MFLQTKNICSEAFGNWSRNKNIKPKKSTGLGQFDIHPLMPSRVKGSYFFQYELSSLNFGFRQTNTQD